jgi:VCBS repeat-containing protein
MDVSLSVGNGTLELLSSTGLTVTDADGSDGTLAFSGTLSDINAALAALQYTGNADFNGTDALSITVSDNGNTGLGGALSVTKSVAINVASVNDAPVIPTEALLYQVENPSFSGGVPSYTINAAADLTGAIERVQYRMEAEGIDGTLYYAEVSFDAWPGLTAADLAVPTTANGIVIQRDVTNLTVESNYPGVVNGSGFEGRLEIWPYDYSRNAAPGFAGNGATYDVSDTHTGNSSYGSFQIHNLSAPAPQTVFAWNNHNGTPDIGFGNNPGAHPDWTFAGSPNLDESTWSLQISVAGGLESAENAENDAGALLASFDVSDIDTATGLTFKVLNASDEVDTRFEVVAASGTTNGEPGTYELRLNSGESLDHETDPTIGLKVEVNDHGLVNNLTTLPVTVTVSDVNDAPVAVDDTFAPFAETLVTFDPGSWQNIPDGYGGLNWSSDTSPNGSTPDFYFGQYGGRTSGYSANAGANSTFESPDGSEFDLNSLNLRKFGLEQSLAYQTNYAATEVEVSGYRDGVEVYSGVAVSLNFTGTDVALNFENIDAFKISVTGFGAVAGYGLFELDKISYSKGLSISEDAAHTFAAADLVGNDTDADGDTLSVSAVSATSANGAAITLNGDGSVSYDPTASVALQAMGEGDSITDTFIYTVSDGNGGMDTATATMTVTGTNDAASITGDVSGAVREDATPNTVSGNLDSSDIDNADDAFQAVAAGAATANQYGTYAVNAAGVWTYTLDNANPAVDALTNGHTLTDSFTVLSEDGTAQTVNITINGNTGAAALVSGPPLVVAYIDYDGVAGYDPAADTLIARVIDTNQDGFTGAGDELQFGFYPLNYSASAVGAFSGTNQTITSAYGGAGVSGMHIQTQEGGAYYLLDRGDMEQFSSPNFIFKDAIPEQGTGSNQLSLNASAGDPASPNQNASQPSVEFIGVGNQAFLEINFATANDAIITGDVSGAVIEDAALTTVSGDLNAADANNTADAFRVITAGAMTVNSYGTYAVDAAGVWTYTLDNANPAVGALNNGQTLSDSFIVYTEDGTAQTVDIVIDGANDVLVVGTGGDDILIGNDLDNVVNGGAGNDMLTGGLGDDTFVFILGDGVDTVTDFEDGLDLVDVSSFGFASVDDLIFTQDGTDAVITGLGDGQEIRLDNTLVADLGNDDFNFL